jgi:uncharacterized protein YndB with AHSA1/START domain
MTAPVGAFVDIAAPPEVVWRLVSDIKRMPEFSPELRSAQWISAVAEPVVGARFKGTNKHGVSRWSTSCEVVTADPPRVFSYEVGFWGFKVSQWTYEIEPTATGCRLAESTIDRRGSLMKYVGGPATGTIDRPNHNLAGIRKTLDAIKATAERDAVSA